MFTFSAFLYALCKQDIFQEIQLENLFSQYQSTIHLPEVIRWKSTAL